MLTTLNTSYTDTRAADLAWALGREPLPALATLDLELDGARLQLRLLGASHQVLLEEERGSCSETVACIARQQYAASARGGQAGRRLGVRVRGTRGNPVPRVLRGACAGAAGPGLRPSPRSRGRLPRQPARLHRTARPALPGAGPLAYVACVPAGRAVGGDADEGGGTGDGDGALRAGFPGGFFGCGWVRGWSRPRGEAAQCHSPAPLTGRSPQGAVTSTPGVTHQGRTSTRVGDEASCQRDVAFHG